MCHGRKTPLIQLCCISTCLRSYQSGQNDSTFFCIVSDSSISLRSFWRKHQMTIAPVCAVWGPLYYLCSGLDHYLILLKMSPSNLGKGNFSANWISTVFASSSGVDIWRPYPRAKWTVPLWGGCFRVHCAPLARAPSGPCSPLHPSVP